MLRVTVYGEMGTLFRRDLRASEGEFECRAGRLVIRDKRWVAEDVVAGRENVTLELHRSGRYLVVQARERTYAVVFLVVPLAADATHWYRFPRLGSAAD
ncbi:hypothetical protein D3C83_72980 [compost metagenome]